MNDVTATAPESASASAWLDGEPVSFEVAVAEAARRIGASAAALFAHLGTDVDGAREAVLLAEHVGGVLDHAQSGALLRNLDPIRETGGFETTPLEAAVRADVGLWVGPPEAAPDWLVRATPPAHVISFDFPAEQRLTLLAEVRARVKSRAPGKSALVEEIATKLLGAKFGVVGWSAEGQEPLVVEAIHGLVRDLNETTRCSTLATPVADNGVGVQTVCGWMTGFPLRTGFGRGFPEHDPWRFDAQRLVAAGEVDCSIWVSAFSGGAAPVGAVDVALCERGIAATAAVRIDVARPGADHDAILHDARVGGLVARTASAPSDRPSVAATLLAIRSLLGGAPC